MDKPPYPSRSLVNSIYSSEFRQACGGSMLRLSRDGSRRALREGGHAGLGILLRADSPPAGGAAAAL